MSKRVSLIPTCAELEAQIVCCSIVLFKFSDCFSASSEAELGLGARTLVLSYLQCSTFSHGLEKGAERRNAFSSTGKMTSSVRTRSGFGLQITNVYAGFSVS